MVIVVVVIVTVVVVVVGRRISMRFFTTENVTLMSALFLETVVGFDVVTIMVDAVAMRLELLTVKLYIYI